MQRHYLMQFLYFYAIIVFIINIKYLFSNLQYNYYLNLLAQYVSSHCLGFRLTTLHVILQIAVSSCSPQSMINAHVNDFNSSINCTICYNIKELINFRQKIKLTQKE